MAMQDVNIPITSELITAGLSKTEAESLSTDIQRILSSDSLCSEKWRQISKQLLNPQQPFKVHEYLFKKTYQGSKEPNFIWIPSQKEIEGTNLYKYMISQNKKYVFQYIEVYRIFSF